MYIYIIDHFLNKPNSKNYDLIIAIAYNDVECYSTIINHEDLKLYFCLEKYTEKEVKNNEQKLVDNIFFSKKYELKNYSYLVNEKNKPQIIKYSIS